MTTGGPGFAGMAGGDRSWSARRRRRAQGGGDLQDAPAGGSGNTIVAVLAGGPLKGRRIETAVVEGRPPKTLDVADDDGATYRYCLAGWEQAGPSAAYDFLYGV
jgi:hypothetical protein